jgi:putative CRISPR-associated protein (TIGR02619 family)
MSRQIICTVGTSLLTNHDDRPWAGWNARNKDPLPSTSVVQAWLERGDPVHASAETNTLHSLDLAETDALAFLHSDTDEGLFCAERLAEQYRSSCRDIHLERIGRLGYGAAVFTGGLKAFVDVTLRLVRSGRERGYQPLFCASGGFKAEISFLNLIGALLEIEVFYIHELHRELIRLPRLPLSWDSGFVSKHEDFFSWIDSEPRRSCDVESRLKGRPELRWLIEEDEEGYAYLTAAGDLLFKVAQQRLQTTPRATWPESVPRPPVEKNQVSQMEHHRPPGWERFVDRLCRIDCVTVVRYDDAARSGPRAKVIDATAGILGLRFGDSGRDLPLCIQTTARGDEQCALVVHYLRGLR